MTSPIYVDQYVDERPLSAFQWRTFILCYAIVAVDIFDLLAIAFVAPVLSAEWKLSGLSLSYLLSASMVGLAVGATTYGLVSRWVAPRKTMVAALLLLSLSLAISIFTSSPEGLIACRFATGIGAGLAMPGTVVIIYEFSPRARSALLVNLTYAGSAAGSLMCGMFAGWLVPIAGWQSIFVAGSLMSLIVAIVAGLMLPDPLRYLALRPERASELRTILGKIDSAASLDGRSLAASSEDDHREVSGANAVRFGATLVRSATLSIAYFGGLASYYLLASWTPTALTTLGASLREASFVTTAMMVSGLIGALGIGYALGRLPKQPVVALAFAASAAALLAAGHLLADRSALAVILIFCGAALNGAVVSTIAIAPDGFRTSERQLGVAIIFAFGRFGGIVGPLSIGFLVEAGMPLFGLFTVVAGVCFVSALALLADRYRRSNAPG